MKDKPFELKIVIGIAILFGIVNIIACRYQIINEEALFGNLNKDYLSYFIFYIYTGLIFGVVQIFVAIGLYKAIIFAWYLAVFGCFVYLIMNIIYAIFVFPDVFSILLNIACIYLLYRPNVRDFFRNKNVKT